MTPARRPLRWLARRLATAAAVGAVLAGGVVGAAPAWAATIDCTPMGDPACRDLAPVAECVWDNKDGTKTALWGWDNPSTSTLRIDVGNKNKMSPGAEDQGQPTLFLPGRTRNVFTTTYTGTSTTWRLGNETATAGSGTTACSTKPVSQIGSVGVLLLAVLVLVLTSALALVARPRRSPVEVR